MVLPSLQHTAPILKKPETGFTIIELLVSVAIIAILSGVVIVSLGNAREKGRDARRVSDIQQIQLALSRYYDTNNQYPAAIGPAGSSVLVSGNYIESLPLDPSTGAEYSYSASVASPPISAALCSGYHLGADLEGGTTHVALMTDADSHVSYGGSGANAGETLAPLTELCSGSSPDFHGTDAGKCNASSRGTACYDVRP